MHGDFESRRDFWTHRRHERLSTNRHTSLTFSTALSPRTPGPSVPTILSSLTTSSKLPCGSKRIRGIFYNMHYNFCRAHQTRRVTLAMEAGLSDHVWSIQELIGLLDV
jgi:hypothetical protein